jgi:subtilisin
MFIQDPGPEGPAPGTTGRYLVLMREDAIEAGVSALSDVVGASVANAADFDDGAVEGDQLAEAEAVVFDKLAVAVVDVPPEQTQALGTAVAEEDAILAVEPERVVYALQDYSPGNAGLPTTPAEMGSAPRLPVEYLRGYRAAVNHLVDSVLAAGGLPGEVDEQAIVAAFDESSVTWGLQVTKAAASRFSGKGIKVAVLDTGLDLGHPDFQGRSITSSSFVSNQAVQDGHGHGTHCIGTSCGPRQPGQLPRYGIAYGAEIFAGKVLSNQGSGADGGILAGINWAITSGCQVISMSLGAPVQPGQGYSSIFEQVTRRALDQGTLIVAAAGNESQRPTHIAPVGHPANCPSMMAVGALDSRFLVAYFSCGGINPQGGQVDIAGPGVQIRSSWPRPRLYNTISGTSMATPHVAGIAALHAEANRSARGRALWTVLIQNARRLALPSRDIGTGLVQAP